MNTIALAKKLISIPSYVDENCNEESVGEYVYQYLKKNTKLVVEKERVEGNRFNVLAYSRQCINHDKSLSVNTAFIDHIDTVEPKRGCKYDQFSAVENAGKIYGLGSCDTKSNVAVLMKLAETITNQRFLFLFYVDEEYDFKGIKKFIQNNKSRIKIEKIISTDGEDLKVRNGCRGLIEIDIECFGKTGHSANRKNGVDVVTNFYLVKKKCEEYLIKLSSPFLGKPTLNISFLRAGLYLGKKNGQIILGKNGNNIPDFLEATLEFRTTDKISIEKLKKKFIAWFKKVNLNLQIKKVRHNLPAWITNKKDLDFIIKSVKSSKVPVSYTDPGTSGYVDVALLNDAFKCPACCIGVIGVNRHGANEWVDKESITALENILKKVAVNI